MFFNASIANTISAIKVGYIAKQSLVQVPLCKKTEAVLNKLECLGAVESFSKVVILNKPYAKIRLHYKNGRPAITNLSFVYNKKSRFSFSLGNLRKFQKNTWNTVILTTTHGLLTIQEACAEGVGGFVYIVITI